MIIDDLTPTLTDNLTDEIPVEQATSTFKTTWQKILNLFRTNLTPSSGTPAMDGTASQGTANTFSKSDHVHPTDTSRASQTDMTSVTGTIGTTALPTTAQTITGAIDEIYSSTAHDILYFTNVSCIVTTSGGFANISDAAITSDYVVVTVSFTDESVVTGDVAWVTANGSALLSGTCTSTTKASVLLVKKDN